MHGKYTDTQLFKRQFNKKMEKPFDAHGSFLSEGNELNPEQLNAMREAFSQKESELKPPDNRILTHEVKEPEAALDSSGPVVTEVDSVESVATEVNPSESDSKWDSLVPPEIEQITQTPPPDLEHELMDVDPKPETKEPERELVDVDPERELVDVDPERETKKPGKGSLKKTCGNCSRKYKKSSKCENCKNKYCKKHCFAPCRYCKNKKRCLNCIPASKYACKSCMKREKTNELIDDEAEVSGNEKDIGESVWDEGPDDKIYREEMEDELGSLDGFVVSDDEFPEVDFSELHTKRRFDFENDIIHNQKGEKKRKMGKGATKMINPKSTSEAFTTDVIFDIITDPQANLKNYREFLESVKRRVKKTGNEFDAEEFRLTLQYTLVILLKICIPDNRNDLYKYIDENQLDPEIFKEIVNKVERHYLSFVDSISGQKKIGALVQLLDYINKYSEYSYKDTKIRETGKYRCAITGRVLKKGEKVYVLELRTMYNRNLPKVYLYVSRYHDKELPEYYLGIFDVILTNRWYINRIGYRLKHLIDKKNKFPGSMSGQEKIRITLTHSRLKFLVPTLTEQICFQYLLRKLSNFDSIIS